MLEVRALLFDNTEAYKPLRGDSFGRTLTNPHFLMSITTTASSTVTRNDETEIMSGISGQFLNLVWVQAVNTSTNAINLLFRSGRSAGIAFQLMAKASDTTTFPIGSAPFPASEPGAAWTVSQNTAVADSGDSPITVNMLAIQNPAPGL